MKLHLLRVFNFSSTWVSAESCILIYRKGGETFRFEDVEDYEDKI